MNYQLTYEEHSGCDVQGAFLLEALKAAVPHLPAGVERGNALDAIAKAKGETS